MKKWSLYAIMHYCVGLSFEIQMIGLTWDAIDFENRTLTVNKTLEFRHKQHFWRAGPPKT